MIGNTLRHIAHVIRHTMRFGVADTAHSATPTILGREQESELSREDASKRTCHSPATGKRDEAVHDARERRDVTSGSVGLDRRTFHRIATLLDMDPERLDLIYSRETRRQLVIALRALLVTLRGLRSHGPCTIDVLRSEALRMRATFARGVDHILGQNRALELRVRTLAWALDNTMTGPTRTRLVLSAAAPATLDVSEGEIVVWLHDGLVPLELTKAINNAGGILLSGVDAVAGIAESVGIVRCSQTALVEAGSGLASTQRMRLSGAAGVAQALRSDISFGAWRRVVPPRGFLSLEHDIHVDDERASASAGYAELVYLDGDTRNLAVSERSLPKTAISPRSTY